MRRIPGHIGCFPLPDGRFGFCRLLTDACAAFYRHIVETETDLLQTEEYAFTVGVHDSAVRQMKLVQKRPYQDIAEITAPPMKIRDPITGAYSIYHHGEITPAAESECAGLETCAVWELHPVIDRLLGNTKWNV